MDWRTVMIPKDIQEKIEEICKSVKINVIAIMPYEEVRRVQQELSNYILNERVCGKCDRINRCDIIKSFKIDKRIISTFGCTRFTPKKEKK